MVESNKLGKELNTYFDTRKKTLDKLETEREELAKKIYDLIPNELSTFKSGTFNDLKITSNWLQGLYDNQRPDY